MTLGLALHTHGKVSGVDGVRVLKLLDDDEWAASPLRLGNSTPCTSTMLGPFAP